MRVAAHEHANLEVTATEAHNTWERHLERIGLDPELFRYQLAMNRREGAADEAFRFTTAADFIRYLLEMAFESATADQLAKNLEAQRDSLRERPRFELERVFIAAALAELRPLVEAVAKKNEAQAVLELLRCYEVAPPLVWEPGSGEARDGVLILENLHTYESFRRWNTDSGRYRAVAYGHGAELRATIRDLPRLCERLGASCALYFGDLDAAGILIAFDAARELARSGVSVYLAPAVDWYEALLDIGEVRRLSGDGVSPHADALAWFPEPLRRRIESLFSSGLRVPQELVGTELLAASVS